VISFWFVGIFINIFILGLYVFTGVCVASLEFFGGDAVAPIVHVVEGLFPYVLDGLVDTLTENLYNHTYSVRAILVDQNNFDNAHAWLNREAGRASVYSFLLPQFPQLVDNVNLFLVHIPEPFEVLEGLWLPDTPAPENWFIKLFLNVLPQANLSFWVSSQVSPTSLNGLWFLLEFALRPEFFVK